MGTTFWIVVGVIGAVVVIYLLTMRVFFRQSQEEVKRIDYSKVKAWKDDE